MTSRALLMAEFVRLSGWEEATRTTVAGDASNRRYDRLTDADGRTAILMDAPPDKGEDVRPFVDIATYLTSVGLSAPTLFAIDAVNGFLLLEDLGDDLFARVVTRDPACERTLYAAATDVLSHLHRHAPPDIARYDAAAMSLLAALAFDWYGANANGGTDTSARDAFCDAFQALATPLDAVASVLIQRDYHAENLLWLPDRHGVARVGLLDFQDAMLGHPAYDLVSILQDARRDVPPAIVAEMIARYCADAKLSEPDFQRAFAILGLQRNMRILGVFARLCIRDGKAHYVDLIPRVWEHVQTNLGHPDLAHMRPLIDGVLPPPDAPTLDRIRQKCATPQTQ